MKKYYLSVSIFLLIALIAACAAPAAEAPAAEADTAEADAADAAPAAADSGEPVAGGTLRVAFQNEWAGLDPHIASSYSSYQILNNVLEGLTFYDDDMNLQPWLAESWEQSEDGLT
ncbi:MAG: hypothetical protein KDE46_28435, partial [Caldilineaceae bacterium]|nr:hypothetical protein [Caldilineaceae bacterium]